MEEEIKSRKSIENAQIKEIRKEVEALLANPEFEKMSRAFQNSVAKRLGLKELKGSGIVPQARIPVTLGYILKAANITDMEKLKGLESIPITLGDLLKAANITDPEKLKGLESIPITLGDLLKAANITDPEKLKGLESIPITLGDLLKAANITDPEKLKGLESIPIPLGDLLKAANITDMEKLKGLESIQVMYAADWPPFEEEEEPYRYYNVYSYAFW